MNCFFVSDLHGCTYRYGALFERIRSESPHALFIGGDLLPSPFASPNEDGVCSKNFIRSFLVPGFQKLKEKMGASYPRIFVILGNDDGKTVEQEMLDGDRIGIWDYCHFRSVVWEEFTIYGYTYIPPSPFRLKDWERYDVTQYVRPGCIGPEDPKGVFTTAVGVDDLKNSTIEEDLEVLTGEKNLGRSIFLFHSPPHGCKLDRAALDGRRVNDIQVDVHVGSAAIRRFIERKKPLITLHGHIHESTRITGSWLDVFDGTYSFNASHDGTDLSIVRFDPYHPENASRELISIEFAKWLHSNSW